MSPGEHVLVRSSVSGGARVGEINCRPPGFCLGGGRSFEMVGEIKCLRGSTCW